MRRTLLAYGGMTILLLAGAGAVISTLVERQFAGRRLAADPLPEVTLVGTRAESPEVHSWARALTRSGFPLSLTTAETVRSGSGVIVLCDLRELPPTSARVIDAHLASGGGVVISGAWPEGVGPSPDVVPLDGAGSLVVGDDPSPPAARALPGHATRYPADARALSLAAGHGTHPAVWWEARSEPALAYARHGGGRIVWIGFDPSTVASTRGSDFDLIVRSAFRWAAGQPVSTAAAGAGAAELSAGARRLAREQRLAFSVDRLDRGRRFSVQLSNRGSSRIENPTVLFWFPPGVERVAPAGTAFSRRGVRLEHREEGMATISLRSLGRGDERLIILEEVQPPK
jgi:hypothetical protein